MKSCVSLQISCFHHLHYFNVLHLVFRVLSWIPQHLVKAEMRGRHIQGLELDPSTFGQGQDAR